jgi:hypothetical protein
VIETVGIPATLASASVQQARFDRIHTAEQIRALKISDVPETDRPKPLDVARKRFEEELSSEEGRNYLADGASQFLLHALKDTGTARAAAELLRQGTILIWASLEVLARDVFVSYVNQKPQAAKRLLMDTQTRQLFPLKELDLDLLEQHGFDLSESMGKVLAGLHELSTLPAIKQVFSVLFPSADTLHELLNRKEMWVLSQRRHLIVHRRAILDEKYLRDTGETGALGSELQISPDQLERHLQLVRDAGTALLRAARDAQRGEPLGSEKLMGA